MNRETMAYQTDGDGRPCSHCGRTLISYSGGYRTVALGGVLRRLCWSGSYDVVDCYDLVMVAGHPVGMGRGEV